MYKDNIFHQGLQRYLSPHQREKLATARVGVAGAGGLGSNVVMLLARTGIEHFYVVDGDMVDASNLNRQHYFPQHVNMPKVEALADMVRMLNPQAEVLCHHAWLEETSIPALFSHADIWVEALDDAYSKRAFVEQALLADVFVVSASGLAGWGGPPMERRRLGDRLILVGDFSTCVDILHPPLAPRVMQAAAMQADAVLEYILGDTPTFTT